MDINAAIIDHRLNGIVGEIREFARDELSIVNDETCLKSLAFIYLVTKTILDLDAEEAFDCLTEGGGDFGIDAIHISEPIDGEFIVTLIQGKYKANLKGVSNFEEGGIGALINAIRYIFDPSSTLGFINNRLAVKVESVRSMIRDGLYPHVRAIACNNGQKWNQAAQEAIQRSGFGDQVIWDYVNHDTLIGILQRVKSVNETLRLSGKAIVEDMDYCRVCIGRVSVIEIAELMGRNDERLLERNIRRYLGLHGNRVSEGIRETLSSDNSQNFYFFNNGLTLICDDFSYNALQSSDYQVRVEGLQIVNGGQTCMTISKTIDEMREQNKPLPTNASVLVRIYKLPKDNEDIVLAITQATNSQNPVDLKDLHSNDDKQRRLETSIHDFGFTYRRKRMDSPTKPTEITSGTAAEAILSVWRARPHQAKFLTREHFGKLYNTIFTDDLTGAQTIIAVLLYRIAENHRKRPTLSDPFFVRYASCFIAMRMGCHLLMELGIRQTDLTHKNFTEAKSLIERSGEEFFTKAVEDVDRALKSLYGDHEISMLQLSATFRRGDLIAQLQT